jgi:hypothetical protein
MSPFVQWKTLLSICTCILPHVFLFSLYDPNADENNQVKSAFLNPLGSTALRLLLWVPGETADNIHLAQDRIKC